MWAFEWRFESANVFALFRERCFQKDTIPKPGGLDSGGPKSGLYVPALSRICPTFVPLLCLLILRSGGPMEDRLHDVLSGLDAKQGRSRLEPYGEFVDELRCQGFTCGDIAAVLAGGDVSFKTSKSVVSRLVRARARRRRKAARQISRSGAIPTPVKPKPATLQPGRGPSDEEVRRRIAALKAREALRDRKAAFLYSYPSHEHHYRTGRRPRIVEE